MEKRIAFAFTSLLFFLSNNINAAKAVNCSWVPKNLERADSLPKYMKEKYIECLVQSIEEAETERYKKEHSSTHWGAIDFDVFGGSGGWTPLKIPPGANTHNKNGRLISLVVRDAEIRSASPDTAKGTASIDGYVHFAWSDERIKWQPSQWGGISKIEIRPDFASKIWFPLFQVIPNKPGGSSQVSELIVPTVSHLGHIEASTFLDWESSCDMNFARYPSDSATCKTTFEGQWINDSRAIKIDVKKTDIRKSSNYQQTYYWDFASANIRQYRDGDRQLLEISTQINRVNRSGGIEILCPILIATIVAILAPLFGSFKWQSVIKVLALLFMYLSLINFVQIHWVTRYAKEIPGILAFHRFTMIVTLISLIVGLALWTFARRHHTIPPPHMLGKITDRIAGMCACTAIDTKDEAGGSDPAAPDDQWTSALSTLNFLSFILFSIIYILGAIIYCV